MTRPVLPVGHFQASKAPVMEPQQLHAFYGAGAAIALLPQPCAAPNYGGAADSGDGPNV